MVKSIQIKVHKSLQEVLRDLSNKVAGDLKKQYNLKEIEVPGTLASQILAAKQRGQKKMSIKVRKGKKGKGFLELL